MEIYNPFNGDVTDQAVAEWISQFQISERPIVEKLLKGFHYYGSARVAELVKSLYKSILTSTAETPSDIWFVPVGYVAKSGTIIAYYFRVQNGLSEHHFVSPANVSSLPLTPNSTVVFLDDFLGTGNQAIQMWEKVAKSVSEKAKCHFIYAILVAFREGIENVKNNTAFTTIAVDVLDDNDRTFSASSHVFQSEVERKSAEVMIEKYGARLYPNHPFGYRRSQCLIGFFYSTPNNTLPIFWSAQAGWRPLLARGDSYRDPSFLIGPPPGLSVSMTASSPFSSLDVLTQLGKFDIDCESLIQLASEFKESKVVLVLAFILKRIGIDRNVTESLLKLIRTLRDFRHEKEHVRSALHIVPQHSSMESYGKRMLCAAASTTIHSVSRIQALANMIDGLAGGIVIQRDGVVLGNFIYPEASTDERSVLPHCYQPAANASEVSGGMLFLFLPENRIALFFAGQRVLWHRGAVWHLQPTELDRGIRELSLSHDIEPQVLERVIQLSFQLSDAGKGSLITVGDHLSVIAHSDPPKTEHIEWTPIDVASMPVEGLMGVMSQDGATIISGGGEVVRAMTALRPPRGVVVEEETGRGTKHSTAAIISKVTKALCIAVSVDGRITVYSRGSIAFKVMG